MKARNLRMKRLSKLARLGSLMEFTSPDFRAIGCAIRASWSDPILSWQFFGAAGKGSVDLAEVETGSSVLVGTSEAKSIRRSSPEQLMVGWVERLESEWNTDFG